MDKDLRLNAVKLKYWLLVEIRFLVFKLQLKSLAIMLIIKITYFTYGFIHYLFYS